MIIPNSLELIGDGAFYQNISNRLDESQQTEFVWEIIDETKGFESLIIESRCFSNIKPAITEQIETGEGFVETFIPNAIYVPKVANIGSQAFWQYQDSTLEFSLMENSEQEIGKDWINNTNKIIYNYIGVADVTTYSPKMSAVTMTCRYLLSSSAAYLYKRIDKRAISTLYIPTKITYKQSEYILKEILSKSLDVFESINYIYFEADSQLELIESGVFGNNTKQLLDISLINSYSEGDDLDITKDKIPNGLVIETGNNLKDSFWFTTKTGAGFIILGRYLIGRNETDEEKQPGNEYTLDLRDLPDCDTIYDSAFRGANCSKVLFGDNIKYIYSSAFESSKLDYSNDREGADESEIFYLPKNVESIKSQAFYLCKFRRLRFPSTLKDIGSRAFTEKSIMNEGIGTLRHVEFGADCKATGTPFELVTEYQTGVNDPKEVNVTLETLIIPPSMAKVFSSSFSEFRKMSQVHNLYLANIERDENGFCKKTANMPLYKDTEGNIVYNETDTPYIEEGKQVYGYKFFYNIVKDLSGFKNSVLTTFEAESFCPMATVYDDNGEIIRRGFDEDIDLTSLKAYPDGGLNNSISIDMLDISRNQVSVNLSVASLLAILAGFRDDDERQFRTIRLLDQTHWIPLQNYMSIILQTRALKFDNILG